MVLVICDSAEKHNESSIPDSLLEYSGFVLFSVEDGSPVIGINVFKLQQFNIAASPACFFPPICSDP